MAYWYAILTKTDLVENNTAENNTYNVPIKAGVKKGFVECLNIDWLSFGHEAWWRDEELTNKGLKKTIWAKVLGKRQLYKYKKVDFASEKHKKIKNVGIHAKNITQGRVQSSAFWLFEDLRGYRLFVHALILRSSLSLREGLGCKTRVFGEMRKSCFVGG